MTGRPGWEGPNTHRAKRFPSTTDLHWLAGFFEGEGAFVGGWTNDSRHGGPYVRTAVTVAQVDWWPLVKVFELLGGSLRAKKPTTLTNSRWQVIWQVSGSRARGVMMTLYPLLSPRRQEQIRLALGLGSQDTKAPHDTARILLAS